MKRRLINSLCVVVRSLQVLEPKSGQLTQPPDHRSLDFYIYCIKIKGYVRTNTELYSDDQNEKGPKAQLEKRLYPGSWWENLQIRRGLLWQDMEQFNKGSFQRWNSRQCGNELEKSRKLNYISWFLIWLSQVTNPFLGRFLAAVPSTPARQHFPIPSSWATSANLFFVLNPETDKGGFITRNEMAIIRQ